MDARKRRQMLRAIELVSRHPSCANAIGIKVVTRKRKEGEKRSNSLKCLRNYVLANKGESAMRYYLGLVTDNPNHNHEVHKEICAELPSTENREYFGVFSTSQAALNQAKANHPSWSDIDGCRICCPEIHTR